MRTTRWLAISLFASTLTMPVLAQQPVIYPAKSQSPEQLEKDKYECYNWARQSSGFDPMQAQSAPAPSQAGQPAQQSSGGQVVVRWWPVPLPARLSGISPVTMPARAPPLARR